MVLCSNGLCKWCCVAMGFVNGIVGPFWALPTRKIFWAFCGDSVILWPNFGSNVISIICGKSKLDNMWDIMGNICEEAQGNL